MSKLEINCKGHVLFKLGLIPEERYFSLVHVSELSQWFQETSEMQDAVAIAIISGWRWDEESKPNHRVTHMLFINEDGTLSQREDIGYPVSTTTIYRIREEFLDETQSSYLMFLSLLNS